MTRTWLLIAVMVVAGCATEGTRPTDLLPEDTFRETLLEAQLIEARVNNELVDQKRTDVPVKQYYAEMFKAQGVPEEAFKRTFQWYSEHPTELKVVYEAIAMELQRRADGQKVP
jgi:Domain of unknown function (DUF4296)